MRISKRLAMAELRLLLAQDAGDDAAAYSAQKQIEYLKKLREAGYTTLPLRAQIELAVLGRLPGIWTKRHLSNGK
jgi:hypothetical protein